MKRWIGLAIFATLLAIVMFWPSNLLQAQAAHNITLNWTASTGATSYNVKRGTAAGSETSLATGVSGTTYVDSVGVAGTKYFYVVTAVNAFGESAPSNETSATFLGNPPAPPQGLGAVAN